MNGDPVETEQRQDGPVTGELLDQDVESVQMKVARVKRLAKLMDSAFRIPGTSRKFGLDSLLGLIPGVGDVATTAVSGIIVQEAVRLGVRKRVLAKMVWNIVVDAAVGSIPLVGDIFDFAFKSNTKNVAMLERELESEAASRPRNKNQWGTMPPVCNES